LALDFSELVSVDLVHKVGILIGAFVFIIVIVEIVRWRSILSPIVRARTLGASAWRNIFLRTISNDLLYQQIQVGFEREKWLTHSFVMWGFLLLSVSTTLNYIYNPRGEPLSIWHIVRITGNLGGFLFVVGLGIIVYRFASSDLKRDAGRTADYLFLLLLALAGTTGFAAEFASELNISSMVYGIYIFHLLCCAALLASAPFTKFVHAIGRPLIRLSENYLEALENTRTVHLVPRTES